jgi:hypothetical protein
MGLNRGLRTSDGLLARLWLVWLGAALVSFGAGPVLRLSRCAGLEQSFSRRSDWREHCLPCRLRRRMPISTSHLPAVQPQSYKDSRQPLGKRLCDVLGALHFRGVSAIRPSRQQPVSDRQGRHRAQLHPDPELGEQHCFQSLRPWAPGAVPAKERLGRCALTGFWEEWGTSCR